MKKILIITTGGTIASENKGNGLTPSIGSNVISDCVLELVSFCEIETLDLLNLDSTNIQPEHWLLMAETIRDNYDKYDGFVLIHGTDTMAYTSSALSYLIQNSAKPIVLTGAQRPLTAPITDAKRNLVDSVRFACEENVGGVFIVFAGHVILGTRAKKMKSKSYRAFSSINYPEIALIDGSHVIRYGVIGDEKKEVKFYDKIVPKVFLLRLIPGMDPSILDYIGDHYDALVMETYGMGGVPFPKNRNFLNKMETLYEKNCYVVVATQVMLEGSDLATYEVGYEAMERYDLLEAYDMTTEAAVTKLMWLLSQDLSQEEFKQNFYTPVAYDIIGRA